MLKHIRQIHNNVGVTQPPSGGCVLKPVGFFGCFAALAIQPPSGGCVLKQSIGLRVETKEASRLRAAVC